MRVFVTGATGFVGSAIVEELLDAGHQVLGLARSDTAAKSLTAVGADVHRGDLEDLDSLKRGAAMADGVIHTAFIHDFSRMKETSEVDRCAIEALGSELAGSKRPFIVTSGTALVASGGLVTEDTVIPSGANSIPRVSEQTALSMVSHGVNASVVRLPLSVHGGGDHGFVPMLIGFAREKGASAYVGDRLNRWPAVHRVDAAHLYRLILEKDATGVRYHAVAEEGIPFREIAAVIGTHLKVPVVVKSPEEAASHFGWFARFAALDNPASSKKTRELLKWQPNQPGLIAEINTPR